MSTSDEIGKLRGEIDSLDGELLSLVNRRAARDKFRSAILHNRLSANEPC